MAGHDPKHDTRRTIESKMVGHGHPGDPGLLGHGQPTLYADSVPEYSETGVFYEKEDASSGSVAKVGTFIALATVLSVVVTFVAFKFLVRLENRAQAEGATPAFWHRDAVPPEPRLQTTPALDLAAIRGDEEKRLTSYGWADKPAGIVHIPIEEAIRLYVARNAAAPPPAASPAPPASTASPSPHPAPAVHP